tara:strand:- start:78 stop:677 length:600 start_codon:yes stop_codon:yes gene_type:complete
MLRTTSLIGFGSGTSGGLSPLTDITDSMWDGDTGKYTLSGNDVVKSGAPGGTFNNIRIKNSAPVLDGDFVWQYTQVGDMGGNTDSSYGFYDITEDATWSSTVYRQNLNSMTNSFWFDTRGSIGATPLSFQPFEGGTSKGSTQTFATDDTFKWQRIGTSLKLFVAGSEKYEWTGVSESLRFCVSGFTVDKANISDIQFQN